MRIEQIEIALALSQYKSMQKTADELHISVQNVSKLIKLLEEELHTQLFQRTGYGVFPTADGEFIISELEKALKIIENIQNLYSGAVVIDEQKTVVDHIDILTTPNDRYFAARLLEQLCTKFFINGALLDVEDAFSINERLALDPASTIASHDMVFINVTDRELSAVQNYRSLCDAHFLRKHRIGIMVNKQHPLANFSTVSVKELPNYPMIDHETLSHNYSLLHMALEEISVRIKPKYFLNSDVACTAFIKNNMGYGLVPYDSTFLDTVPEELTVIPLKEQLFIHHIVLINPTFKESPCYSRTLNTLKRQHKYMSLLY